MAIIKLDNMQFYAFHGCYDQEQRVGNRFRVDLSYECDTSKSEQTDSILDTVSYLDVYEEIRTQVMIPSHILEHVCRRIVDRLKLRFPQILTIKVTISKLAPPLGGDLDGVSVTLEV